MQLHNEYVAAIGNLEALMQEKFDVYQTAFERSQRLGAIGIKLREMLNEQQLNALGDAPVEGLIKVLNEKFDQMEETVQARVNSDQYKNSLSDIREARTRIMDSLERHRASAEFLGKAPKLVHSWIEVREEALQKIEELLKKLPDLATKVFIP